MAISNVNLAMSASSYGAYQQKLSSATRAELEALGIPYDPNTTTEAEAKALIAQFKAKKANNEKAKGDFTKNQNKKTSDLFERAKKLAETLGIPTDKVEFKTLLALIEQKLENKITSAQNNETLLKQLEGYAQELASIQAESIGAGFDTTNRALEKSLEMLSLYNQNFLNK